MTDQLADEVLDDLRVLSSMTPTRVEPFFYAYSHRTPLAGVQFGQGTEVRADSAAAARALSAIFADLAAQHDAWQAANCSECYAVLPRHVGPSCSRWRQPDALDGLVAEPRPEAASGATSWSPVPAAELEPLPEVTP